MEQLHNEWPIKNGAEKEVEFETTDDVGRYVHTWCLAAAAATAAGFILDDEGIVANWESHAIPREKDDPQPKRPSPRSIDGWGRGRRR